MSLSKGKQFLFYSESAFLACRTGEAQQIDRIMEKFAERYCRENPEAFTSADGAYLLSFAIIMLNTDAHNPMADAHMSKDDFVMMCQTQVCIVLVLCPRHCCELLSIASDIF